ncbi:MAG: hypothetical protein E7415_06130 [Ruminococcaceae bacterium]|nr:hypothetical protein [Oscillospiraceae bacterium]
MKRVLYFLIGIMLSLTISVCGAEVNYVDGENVIYRNDFSDYTGGRFAPENWNGKACWMQVELFSKGENNGNVGLKASASTPLKAFYRMPQTMTSGCLYVSFDISRGENTAGQSHFSMQDDTDILQSGVHDKYVFYADAEAGIFFGPAENIGQWGDKSVTLPYEKNTVYSVQLICDYSNKKQYTYIDGALLSMVPFEGINSEFTGISRLHFRFAGVDYVDNLHISYMNEESFSGKATVIDSKTVKVEFTEGLSSHSSILEAEIINTLTNEKAVISEVKKKGIFEYEIKLENEMTEGDIYLIKPKSEITNALGKALSESITFSMVKDSSKLYISGAEAIDYKGDEAKLYEEITSPSNKIKLSFTDKLIEAPTGITSDAGEIKRVSLADDNKAVVIEFKDYFLEKGEYKISIPQGIEGEGGKVSAKAYELPFKTGEGTVKLLDFGFYKDGNRVTAESLNHGDKILLKADIIKTVKGKYPAILSYSGWTDMMMTEFNFTDLSLTENETEKSGEIEIIYNKENNVKLQGFLRKGLSFINPLADKVEL